MLEVRLPRVLQAVQTSLREQDERRELKRRERERRSQDLQALVDEILFIERTPLIPVMQTAASLLQKANQRIDLQISGPVEALTRKEPVVVTLVWQSGNTYPNEVAVTTKREEGKIVGFRYNAFEFPSVTYWKHTGYKSFESDLSLLQISEAVDQVVADPRQTNILRFRDRRIEIPKSK